MSDVPGAGGSSFERMRAMLLRAAEIREDEQTQVFDALDQIAARLAGLDALGTIRKRVAELPDSTVVAGVAERVEHAITALGSLDGAIDALSPAVEAVPTHITPALSDLGERFDALGRRIDALAERIDGTERRVGATGEDIGRLRAEQAAMRGELERLPRTVADAVTDRVRDAVTGPIVQRAETTRDELTDRIAALERTVTERITEDREAEREQQAERMRAERDRVVEVVENVSDAVTRARTGIAAELNELGTATRGVDERLAALRTELIERFDGALADVGERVERLCGEIATRPDAEALTGRLREFSDEVATRHREALDEAMATFAELTVTPSPVALPLARSAPEPGRRSPQRFRHAPRRERHPFGDTDPDAADQDPDAGHG